jgi:phage baseplate assembly protein W
LATRVTLKSTDIKNEQDKNYIGLKLPLEKSDGSEGYFESTLVTLDAAKENVRNLLYTFKGERIMQPNFGSGLREFLFEELNETTEALIKEDIISTIETWLPYILILELKCDSEYSNMLDKNKIKITLKMAIKTNPNMFDSLELEIG